MSATTNVPSPSVFQSQEMSLWEAALQKLPDSERSLINVENGNKLEILYQILALAENKKEFCLQRRWKFRKKGGEIVIIRDKLEKITTWITRFKEVGSTAVQHDPVHAAVPWAGILIILQVAMNDAQTFGAMVDGVERVSSILPRCACLEEVYFQPAVPLSIARKQMQLAMVKLYTSILRYLAKARQYFSAHTVKRIVKSALGTSESEVQQYLDIISKKLADVESCLLIVQLEENRATSAKTEKITQYLSALGRPIIRSSAQLTELHKSLSRQERTRILSWLSQMNTRYHHQLEGKDHLPGSGNWLLEHPEFIRWQDTSSSAILWLHGIPGCGKTKLAYKTIQKLLQDNTVSPNPAPVAYFYCARNPAEPNRSNPDEVIRSILKQLSINSQGEIKDIIVKEFKVRDKESELDGTDIVAMNPSDTQDMMLRLFERDPATIVIDALDECDPAQRHRLLSALGDILRQSSNVIKIMVTSRDDGDICCHLSSSPNIYIRADDNRQDIERFIDYTLSQALASMRLLHGKMPDDLVQEVSRTLKDKAQGMFRWVTLQIDNLCDSRRIKIESDVREEVGQLPQTLRESYDRSYRHILDLSRPSRVLAERVFKWLLCAQKLMTTQELVAAVIFASEHHVISSQNILDICYNMVVIDDQGHVRFAHLSVREYLETLDSYTTAECHAFVLQRCLDSYTNTAIDWAYQLRDCLDIEIKPYAMLYWPVHCIHIGDYWKSNTLASILVTFFFQDATSNQGLVSANNTMPQKYSDAFEDWVSDVWNLHQSSQAFEVDEWLLERLESIASPSASPLFLACTFGFVWLLEMMQSSKWTEWDLLNNQNEGAIQLACKWGNTQVLAWILEQLTIPSNTMVEALSVAIEYGHHDIAKKLIEQRVNAYGEVQGKGSPLLAATVAGSVDLVSVILSKTEQFEAHAFAEAMVFAYDTDRGRLFPIFWENCTSLKACHYFRLVLAVQAMVLEDNPFVHRLQDLEELLSALLEFSRHSKLPGLHLIYKLHGVMGNSFQNLGVLRNGTLTASNPVASEDSSWGPVERANPPREDLYNFLASALSLAGDSIEVFGMLLDLGAASIRGLEEYLCRDEGEKIILSHWREGWHLFNLLREPDAEIASQKIKLLLDHGLNGSVTDHKGRTPLMLATKSDPPVILDALLRGHASIEIFDHKGQNALAHALKNENEPAIVKLIDHGADVNSSVFANSYMSPLEFVASNICSHSLIDVLRKRNARRPGNVAIEDYLSVPFLALVSTSCKGCVVHLLRSGSMEQDHCSGIIGIFNTLIASRELASHISPFGDDDASCSSDDDASSSDDDDSSCSDPVEQLQTVTLIESQALEAIGKIAVNCRSWEDGLTPLQAAICLGRDKAVKKLLDIPVDVNAVDNQGFSALHYAATIYNGRNSIIDQLLVNGADPSLQDRNERTPLHIAARLGHWSDYPVTALIKVMELDQINIQDANGNTALHIAAIAADVQVIELIFNAGANISIRNKDGRTPIDLAVCSCPRAFIRILEQKLNIFSDAHQILLDKSIIADSSGGQATCFEYEKNEPLLEDDEDEGGDDNDSTDSRSHDCTVLALPGDKSIKLQPAMESNSRLETDVDWFNAYDVPAWTALSGRRTLPLRPLCAIFRDDS